MKFIKCPNGKVWARDDEGMISGTVLVPEFENKADLEAVLDSIAEAATGSIVGLTNLTHRYLGGDMVWFVAVPEILDTEPEDCIELEETSSELQALLVEQYGLNDIEVEHALDNLDNDYGEECVVAIVGTARELRCPAYPAACEYVRIVIDGFELAYWDQAEWGRAPAEVMGAIFGAARG